MKSLLLMAGASLLALVAARQGADAPAELTWLTELDQAALLAKKTGKPMLAVFR